MKKSSDDSRTIQGHHVTSRLGPEKSEDSRQTSIPPFHLPSCLSPLSILCLSLAFNLRSPRLPFPIMDLNNIRDQVSNLTMYDIKAGVRKVQNGESPAV